MTDLLVRRWAAIVSRTARTPPFGCEDGPMADADIFDADLLLSMPRLAGLVVSPDGRRLVTSVSRLDKAGKKFVSALWQVDPSGHEAPRRLTSSAAGES